MKLLAENVVNTNTERAPPQTHIHKQGHLKPTHTQTTSTPFYGMIPAEWSGILQIRQSRKVLQNANSSVAKRVKISQQKHYEPKTQKATTIRATLSENCVKLLLSLG